MKKINTMMMAAAVLVGVSGTALVAQEQPGTSAVPEVPAVPGEKYSSELDKILELFKGILNAQGDEKCNADNKRICTKIHNALLEIESFQTEDLPKIKGDASKFSDEASPLVADLKGLREDVIAITKMKPHTPTTFPGKCVEYTKPTNNGWVMLKSGSNNVYQLYRTPNKEERPIATISSKVGKMGASKGFLPSTVVNDHVEVVIQGDEVVCIGKTLN